ncbi:EmrB/QacA subfamily drug resistance transporter [Arcanobacterium pluranimalium]|uniref:DHA2 family efflux MFS transporter permease subunit n=1 Tax=Arcanobacterium pluranimalium TaxID=108028 RepID=UPI00195E655A|nr:DHA2 family efflux MFS transporter permease subunit [Arcanobacterium pluranimalium]MBM7824470.1 EmrB/QacA subfamily drug resistance transporter [Arcanobacterium pluranimalium]
MNEKISTSATRKDWFGLAILAIGLGMIVLDGTIVGVALPSIIKDLHLNLTDAQWVNSLYSVVFAAFLLAVGRIADAGGRQRVFLLGTVVFAASSLMAALAQGTGTLIAARALQGIGGAMVLPSSLSTVNAIFRGKDRAAAFGIWGAVMSGAAAIGPLLGGWLTTSYSWRWIFIVNIPISVVVVTLGMFTIRNTRGEVNDGFDIVGFVTSALGFGLVIFGLIEGNSLGWWGIKQVFKIGSYTWSWSISPAPLALIIGTLFIVVFLWWEAQRTRNSRSALLNISLFRFTSFNAGNTAAAMISIGEFVLVFVIPLFLVSVLHLDALESGWVLAAMAGGAFLAGAMARQLAAKISALNVVILGLVLELVGVGLTVMFLENSPSAKGIATTLAIYGLGLGLASAQLTSTVLGDVPSAHSGSASATQSTVRQIGSAIGSALAGSILAHSIGVDFTRATATLFTDGTVHSLIASLVFLGLGLAATIFLSFTAKHQVNA